MKISIYLMGLVASLLCVTSCSADNNDNEWRALDNQNTVLLTLPHGKVVIELAPQFSPKHVAQFKGLVKQGFYDGITFNRVIDGFVAQAGPKEDSEKDKLVPLVDMESHWSTPATWSFTKVQDKDFYAAQTGFKDSFAVAYEPASKAENTGKAWLTHCPGVLAMARQNEADSASSHFYFVIGQAPRYLDGIMTIFGRVVYGMQHIQAIQRTAAIEGEYAVDSREHTPIVKMEMMADVPKEQQIIIEVENTASPAFAERIEKRRHRTHEFFYQKPRPVLDVCQIPLRSRLVK